MNNPVDSDYTPLLRALAVGAGTSVLSAAEWGKRLRPIPEGDRFSAELRSEWLPAVPPSAACEQIAEKVREHLAEWHSGWPNLWAHLLRVAGYTLRLAPTVQIAPDHAYALALLHDIGKLDEMRDGTPHETRAESMTPALLDGAFPDAVVRQIAAAVGKNSKSGDPLVRLLHDADKLDKIGASGIVRRVSLVVTVENAREALYRIDDDLARFPSMKIEEAETMAGRKRYFTKTFLAKALSTGVPH